MDKFQIMKNLGDGTYGTVFEAVNKKTRELVAIKKMKAKFDCWDDAMNLREVRTLRKLSHGNVVKLKEVIRVQNELYLVFEHMKGTILDSLKENHRYRGTLGLPSDVVKSIVLQCLQGLEYVHSKSFIHRDLKPENLLFSDGSLKIADFGLSKEYICYREQHTNYVSTRWYRAPELLLR